MKKVITLCFILFSISVLMAQTADTNARGKWKFSAYGDMYFTYDFTEPNNNERHHFLYNYKRHNEFNINLALIHANYTYKGLTMNVGLNSGTFPQYNMAHELPLLQSIYEANISYAFSKKLDFTMGMFPSHLGFEGFKSADNDVLTHSLVSENTPYYVTGAKLGFRAFKKFKITALLTNGWQIITETPANTNKAIGLQLEFDPIDKIHINYSNIYSNEAPDSAAVWIFYQNLYGIFDIHKRFRITAGVDIGLGDNAANNVQSMVALGTLIARYKISEKWAFAARGEVYSDPKGLIIVSPTPNTFEVFCYSGNLDFAPNNNLLFRVEGRAFTAASPVFREDRDNPQAPAFNKFVNQAMAVTFAMQVKID